MTSIRDPNGIRTRVTAVKGRCPRPLDDRVRKAGQYQKQAGGCYLACGASGLSAGGHCGRRCGATRLHRSDCRRGTGKRARTWSSSGRDQNSASIASKGRQIRRHLADNPFALAEQLGRQRHKHVIFGSFTIDLDQVDLAQSEIGNDFTGVLHLTGGWGERVDHSPPLPGQRNRLNRRCRTDGDVGMGGAKRVIKTSILERPTTFFPGSESLPDAAQIRDFRARKQLAEKGWTRRCCCRCRESRAAEEQPEDNTPPCHRSGAGLGRSQADPRSPDDKNVAPVPTQFSTGCPRTPARARVRARATSIENRSDRDRRKREDVANSFQH